ncbi:nucleotidyl transferase AbiEii/AbiGii toxin family protein [Jongsikchunia kroppenstedtii]|uniref:nucleotidyl transferase AbiEii/AbiGii toxin family protein n=1 Tax=Jongsikchunia kroppenstedtii TaxID=1121721 RepID=UPI00039D97BF|nr:nucleotidyl transferase AbiEii/AbiGii toxin family protein [Jongsikchunia kroppenstedtii]
MKIDERDSTAEQFGVSHAQVERDHLISHLLAAIASAVGDRVMFIGGTALARTHLPKGRLSEDIDLVALDRRSEIAAEIDLVLPRAVARSHGRLSWDPPLSGIPDTASARLVGASRMSVKVQLLSARDRITWPSETRAITQRYADTPPATFTVPTLASFAGSKTSTWHDRGAARDLWDLWALDRIGAIDAEAGELYRRFGPTNRLPSADLFRQGPSEAEWRSQLAGQTRLTITAAEALVSVAAGWAAVGTD